MLGNSPDLREVCIDCYGNAVLAFGNVHTASSAPLAEPLTLVISTQSPDHYPPPPSRDQSARPDFFLLDDLSNRVRLFSDSASQLTGEKRSHVDPSELTVKDGRPKFADDDVISLLFSFVGELAIR